MKIEEIFKQVAKRHGRTAKSIRLNSFGPRAHTAARREAIFRAASAGIPYSEIAQFIDRSEHVVRTAVSKYGKDNGKSRSTLFGQRRFVVEAGGVCWFTIKDCAAHFGVGLDAVYYHLGNGTLDRLGRPRRGGKGCNKPIRLGLFAFESREIGRAHV